MVSEVVSSKMLHNTVKNVKCLVFYSLIILGVQFNFQSLLYKFFNAVIGRLQKVFFCH